MNLNLVFNRADVVRALRPLFILLVAVMSSATWARPLRIVVDAGHGGPDRGAVRQSVAEANMTLKIANKVSTLLKNDPRFEVLQTRETDTLMPLETRKRHAETFRGDVFLSLHANSSVDPRARGAEFYILSSTGGDEESLFLSSRELAEARKLNEADQRSQQSDLDLILSDLERTQHATLSIELTRQLYNSWTLGKRRARQADFFLLRQVQMPTLLLEIGYLSNRQDLALIATENFQLQVAQQIRQALIRYKENVDMGSARH